MIHPTKENKWLCKRHTHIWMYLLFPVTEFCFVRLFMFCLILYLREQRADCINSFLWRSRSLSHSSPAQRLTTIDPFSFAQDKWPYYHRGPFKIGSRQAWQHTFEKIQTCSVSCACFSGKTSKARFTDQTSFRACLGFLVSRGSSRATLGKTTGSDSL